MRIIIVILCGLLISNCSNSYVKNKKTINSPNDLMKFTNVWCDKNKSTDNIIKMCGQGWSKDVLRRRARRLFPDGQKLSLTFPLELEPS